MIYKRVITRVILFLLYSSDEGWKLSTGTNQSFLIGDKGI